jgi:hypothetical protein
MASLPKPEKCDKCSSMEFHREFNPERWICLNNHIVIQREQIIHGVCKCGVKKSDGVLFKENKNQCMECYRKYMADYRIKNQEKLSQQKKNFYINNHDRIRAESNEYYTSTPEIFLAGLLRRARNLSKNKIVRAGQDKHRKIPHEFNLTNEHLIDLWNKQNHKCALTGIDLIHKWGYLASASIDRIDSDKGYVVGNVQLICKGINMMKNNHTQQETIDFLRSIGVTIQ